jgi:hypothetical protein
LEPSFLLFDIVLASKDVSALVMVDESLLYALVVGVGDQAAVRGGVEIKKSSIQRLAAHILACPTSRRRCARGLKVAGQAIGALLRPSSGNCASTLLAAQYSGVS